KGILSGTLSSGYGAGVGCCAWTPEPTNAIVTTAVKTALANMADLLGWKRLRVVLGRMNRLRHRLHPDHGCRAKARAQCHCHPTPRTILGVFQTRPRRPAQSSRDCKNYRRRSLFAVPRVRFRPVSSEAEDRRAVWPRCWRGASIDCQA